MGKLESREDLIRKTSRVVQKAAERGKRNLFLRLTSKNAEKIAQLMQEKPIFYKNELNAPQEILLDDDIAELMPKDFYKDPTAWIESKKNVVRLGEEEELPKGEHIGEIWFVPYDTSKVKTFELKSKKKSVKVVSKRLNQKEADEIAMARFAYEKGIPTPKVLGEIYDKGNCYALFEHIESRNLYAIVKKEWRMLKYFASEIFSCSTKKELEQIILEFSITEKISKECLNQIMLLWRESRMDILATKLKPLLFHLEAGYQVIHPSAGLRWLYLKDKIDEFKRIYDASENDMKSLLAQFGFEGYAELDSFLLKLRRCFDNNQYHPYHKFVLAVNKKSSAFQEKLNTLRDKIFDLLNQDYFGVNLEAEIERIKQKCDEAGIAHKDFALRNLILEWDSKNNRPLRRKGRPARLMLIDWEPESHSLQRG